jgi:hypothetical protein
VLQPHVAKKLVYTQLKEVETLRAVGVRIAGVEQLAAMHWRWALGVWYLAAGCVARHRQPTAMPPLVLYVLL